MRLLNIKNNIGRIALFLLPLFILLLLLPNHVYASINEVIKDGIYVYKITNNEENQVNLVGIEFTEEMKEVLIPGTVNIDGITYTVDKVYIEYNYYGSQFSDYSQFYPKVNKITIGDDFKGSIYNPEYAFPNMKTMEFLGDTAPKSVDLSITNSENMVDILFIVPEGMVDEYKKVIQYELYSDHSDSSIPLTPTIVSKGEDSIEYGFFQYKGIIYKVTKSAKNGVGNVSLIGLIQKFREYNNDYLSLPDELNNNGYQYNITHIAKFGLFGACSKVIILPNTITSMDSHIFDECVEILFLSNQAKTIPSYLITGESNESNLKFIYVPEGVTTIKDNAFNRTYRSSEHTTSIILPTTIKSLGSKSLYQIDLVTFLNKNPIANIKSAIKNGTTVKVAKASIKSYQSLVNPKVTVVEAKTIVKSKKITINKSSISLNVRKSYTLKGTLSKGSNENIYWISSNPDVATVTSKGVVKAQKEGTAYIIAYTRTSGLKTSVKVTVKK